MEGLESAPAAWIMQACESNVSIEGTHLKEVLHIADHLGIANFSASSGWIDRFKRRQYIVYRTVIK
jgi:centromere protein B